LAAGTGFAANVALPDCIPPDAKIVFGVSLRSLLDSPVLKSFQSDMQKMSADLMRGGPSGPLPVLEMIKSGPLSGFDPLKDVDDLIITSSAQNDKATGLIVMHGRFDPKRFPGASTSYNGVLISGARRRAPTRSRCWMNPRRLWEISPKCVAPSTAGSIRPGLNRRSSKECV
jgi:hypothetical protein